ncbi:hypothetical protein DXG03_004206 [Asterophora parasitica]|uniref:Calcineurin-like phosphoesterase domain-containing protein n=1 Tax=Asterophora parasitica TaxID=117018 RepID=A0A9P7KD28_9AGAR|nr:hypothetical protein DXG03_004206 [Asterophora parasitica]
MDCVTSFNMSLDALLHRRPPTPWEKFAASPLLFISKLAYSSISTPSHVSSSPTSLRLVLISDTHSTHSSQPALPDGDILIHSGDLTHSGTYAELSSALSWLASQPHTHKVFIAGNHDALLADHDSLDRKELLGLYSGLTYLEDEATVLTVRGRSVHLYGSPRTPKHGSGVFQYPRAPSSILDDVWQERDIPPTTDILITHGPPLHHLDLGVGCPALLSTLWHIQPRLHVFGHIHGARGIEFLPFTRAQAAYERVCACVRARTGVKGLEGGGWIDAISVVWAAVFTACGWGRSRTREGTLLVNAAAVEGLRDDILRGAVVVDLQLNAIDRELEAR